MSIEVTYISTTSQIVPHHFWYFTPPMVRTLPPEILDRIIDEFATFKDLEADRDLWWPREIHDYKCLQTLLFVSRDTATRARHHLFERVELALITNAKSEIRPKDKKQLSLMTDIITSSAKSRGLGILPHIRRVFIFCHLPSRDSDEEDTEPAQPVEDQLVEDNSGFHKQLCEILHIIGRKALRVDEFHFTTNEGVWDSTPSTLDALNYYSWVEYIPSDVKQAVFDFIQTARLKTLSLIQFSDVPVDLLLGTQITRAFLHCLPGNDSSSLSLDKKEPRLGPPITKLQTLDYILDDVTKLICSQSRSSSTLVRELSLHVTMSWLYFDVDEDRFVRLGKAITDFYTSIDRLNLVFEGIYLDEDQEQAMFDLSVWTMIIDIRKLPKLTHLSIRHAYACGALKHCDISGPGVRNLITILTYCPHTLTSIRWEVGFPFDHVFGDDLKGKLADEYSELDELLTTRFPSLQAFAVCFHIHPERCPAYKEGCRRRLRSAFPHLGDKLHINPPI